MCTTAHALASVRAVENALGLRIPTNARLVRNLMAGIQFVQDHVIHFYHLHALDWVDLASALKADPAETANLAQETSGWALSSRAYFSEVRQRLAAFVDSGQLGPFANAYWGHPAYRLPAAANLLAVAHYLEALDWQRDVIRIQALLGGKNPHPQTYVVGGMAMGVDPNSPTALTSRRLSNITELTAKASAFVNQVYVPDVLLVAGYYKDWATIGAGIGNYLAYGDFPEDDSGEPSGFYLPRGRIMDRDLGKVEPVDQSAIAETVAHSWYRYSDDDAALRHPSKGETTPAYTGPLPPYEAIETDKYSWLKAPRYDGQPMEVGPLARMLVAYASGHPDVKTAVDGALAALGVGPSALFSTLGRVAARAIETKLLVARLGTWQAALEANLATGDLAIADTSRWDPSSWPRHAEGWGLEEAPRGALGHWIVIDDQKITNYQLVVPSTWNGSPRDAKGSRGAWEEALIGTPIADAAQPLEILRTVHSFDPCLSCAVHVYDATGTRGVAVT